MITLDGHMNHLNHKENVELLDRLKPFIESLKQMRLDELNKKQHIDDNLFEVECHSTHSHLHNILI